MQHCSRRVRLAHVIYHLNVGGGEQFLADLGEALAGRGLDQHVWCIGPAGPLAAQLQAASVPVTALNKRTRMGGWTVARLAASLRRFCPDVFLAHGEAGVIWGLPAAALAGVAVRVALLYQNYPESFLRMTAIKRLLPLATRVVAGSSSVALFTVQTFGIDPTLISTIHCGVPKERYQNVRKCTGDRGRTLLTIGRLVPRKGQDVLMRATAVLRSRGLEVRLVIVGDGPCMASLASLARSLGIDGQVEFRGTVWPDTQVWEEADVFVFPSIIEPQGIVVLEAFACGVPVVASDTGGIPEMIEQERSGLLVPPNDPAALASAIERVLLEPGLPSRLVACARQRLQSFDITHTAEIYDELCRRLWADSSRAGAGKRGADA